MRPFHLSAILALAIALIPLSSIGFAQGVGVRDAQGKAKPPEALRTETVQFGSWVVACQQSASGAGPKTCSATLRAADKDRKVGLSWILTKSSEGKLMTAVQTPLGINIPAGVELGTGKGAGLKIPHANCDAQFCEAVGPVEPRLLAQIKAAAQVSLTITGKDGKKYKFDIDNKGASQAIAAMGL
jgi:invasion protein IalB